MTSLLADTHAVIWFLQLSARLSLTARNAFQQAVDARDPVYIASISLVEARYLVERDRITVAAFDRLVGAVSSAEFGFVLVPLDEEIALAVEGITRTEVPEMPDRIIAATALYLKVPLVTRDRKIRTTHIETVW